MLSAIVTPHFLCFLDVHRVPFANPAALPNCSFFRIYTTVFLQLFASRRKDG